MSTPLKRRINAGTEALNLGGVGNHIDNGPGLIRSATRPNNDAKILAFFVPANAMIAVELKWTAEILISSKQGHPSKRLQQQAEAIEKGVWEHGIVQHKKFGDVFCVWS